MREFRFALLGFTAMVIAAGVSYFWAMHTAGNLSISSDNQDWGGFGSYVGGILAPAAALLAGYLVYVGFASNAYQQKLLLARESISRLDTVLETKLDAPFINKCYGDDYSGQPFRYIIIALSKGEIPPTEDTAKGILGLLHNIAIMTNSVRYYIDLLGGLPSAESDSHWLGELEQAYWIEKYSPICTRMVWIVGQSAFEGKVSKEHLRSYNYVMRGEAFSDALK